MKISVIIPFYNLERYVRECLDSVVGALQKLNSTVDLDLQPRPLLEVICVDDGSTDATGVLLDAYSEKSKSRVEVEEGCSDRHSPTSTLNFNFTIIHQPNGGEGAARNAGMAVATGDWITFLDGDDVWLENHLAVAVPVLAHHAQADLVSFGFAPFEDGREPPKAEVSFSSEADGSPRQRGDVLDVSEEIPDRAILDVGVYPTFYRREFLKGMSFSKLPLGADRLFVAQCLARASTVVKSDTVIHGYRLRANSMAHCAWSARKVMSQCDYALGSLRALAASGRKLGREGHSYLASLWLSDVPNRILRLGGTDRREAWSHWAETLDASSRDADASSRQRGSVVAQLGRYEGARRILAACRRSMMLSLVLARLMRKFGIV